MLGTSFCAAAALCYTGSNISMRFLAGSGADPMWSVCVREFVTVAVVGPWLLAKGLGGLPVIPRPRTFVLLVLAGLAVELGGNLGFQWALGVVGLGVTISAAYAVMLISAAVMGLIFLGESVPARSAASIGLLVASIALLYLGAGQLSRSNFVAGAAAPSLPRVLLGLGAACLAGSTFALLSISIRHATATGVPVASIVVIITATGVLGLGALSLRQLGPAGLAATRPEQLAVMLAAGVFNLLGFLAISTGLRYTTVVHANVLNASQVALGALAGIVLFREPYTIWLAAGTLLTVAGVLLVGRPEAGKPRGADAQIPDARLPEIKSQLPNSKVQEGAEVGVAEDTDAAI
jgi:drug/metabolite transporter (DMT)-like permease